MRNLVDPASSHMLVPKIKPCMSQYEFCRRRSCEWLIITVTISWVVSRYVDTRGNPRANTRRITRLLGSGAFARCRTIPRSGFLDDLW